MITEMSACQIVKQIKEKKISAVDVAQAFIERIQAVNPAINAIHQFDPERILREAAQKDQPRVFSDWDECSLAKTVIC